jgi:hypothetical protein
MSRLAHWRQTEDGALRFARFVISFAAYLVLALIIAIVLQSVANWLFG